MPPCVKLTPREESKLQSRDRGYAGNFLKTGRESEVYTAADRNTMYNMRK